MNILAFDTCMDKMYVTLESNGKITSKIVETTKEHYHSAFLISTIKDILKENDLTPFDINVIATNIGPGSFTGIRACTTVARVFAQGVNVGVNDGIKVIGVSSLEILSRIGPLSDSPPQAGRENSILVALDARKDMAYVAVYDNKKEILAPQTMLIEDLKQMLEKERQFVITDDKLTPVLSGISYQQLENDLGKILIEITKEKLDEGYETDWRKLHPLYIQPPPVTVKKT